MRKWCRFVCTTIADPVLDSYRIMPSHRLWRLWPPTSDLVIPTLFFMQSCRTGQLYLAANLRRSSSDRSVNAARSLLHSGAGGRYRSIRAAGARAAAKLPAVCRTARRCCCRSTGQTDGRKAVPLHGRSPLLAGRVNKRWHGSAGAASSYIAYLAYVHGKFQALAMPRSAIPAKHDTCCDNNPLLQWRKQELGVGENDPYSLSLHPPALSLPRSPFPAAKRPP